MLAISAHMLRSPDHRSAGSFRRRLNFEDSRLCAGLTVHARAGFVPEYTQHNLHCGVLHHVLVYLLSLTLLPALATSRDIRTSACSFRHTLRLTSLSTLQKKMSDGKVCLTACERHGHTDARLLLSPA